MTVQTGTEQGTALQRKMSAQVSTIRDVFQKSMPQIEMAIPKHLTASRLLRIAMTSIQRNQTLMECTPASLIAAVMQSAQLGLEPDNLLGMAYLIPFWNSKKRVFEAQLQPGYKGLLKLARNSGEITTVQAHIVRVGDHFVYRFGLQPVLEHDPKMDGEPGRALFAYAVIGLKDGAGHQFDVMTVGEINTHRDRYSRAWQKDKEKSIWGTNWDEMAKKTVLKRVLKTSPASVELQRAIMLDDRDEAGLPQDLAATMIDGEDPTPDDPQPEATGNGPGNGADDNGSPTGPAEQRPLEMPKRKEPTAEMK